MTLLAVDIGNTTVHVGIYDPETGVWAKILRFSSGLDRTDDDWLSAFYAHVGNNAGEDSGWTQVVCCSVVPALTASFADFSRRHLELEPLLVSWTIELGIKVTTQPPQATGADRIVNAAAAFAEFGGPVVTVDLGTATKIDAISADGEFLGGAIAPGLGLSIDSLAQRTAQLRSVPLSFPDQVIGSNTVEAIQAGVVVGHAKLVDGLVAQTVSELGDANAVVMTGGFSGLMFSACVTATHHRPTLTLDGLALIAAMNP
jgi:type III pantothenate kinase